LVISTQKLFNCWYISHKSSSTYMFLWLIVLTQQPQGTLIKGQVFVPDNLGVGIASCCLPCWIHSLSMDNRFAAHSILYRICIYHWCGMSMVDNDWNTILLTLGTVEHSDTLQIFTKCHLLPPWMMTKQFPF
jgi:hypothetical protein